MTTNASLAAQSRSGTGKGPNRRLRAAGRVPAVVYGHGDQTRSVSIDAHELERLFSRIQVENTIITLDIDGESAPVRTLVREVQSHPVRNHVIHVDFYQIHAGERITLEIPIRLVGQSVGVKAGGILQHNLDVLEVTCLPDAIPEAIDVDITLLEVGDSIHVSDIAIPEGVEVEVEGDRTVCSVIPPVVVEEAPAEVVEETTAEPEVIAKGKAEEEGEEAE
ncbi:MAG: 50S ribosomal protein L25/general stress protein Ctc [Gemmatimonadetes bacterium]|nr:50S ribosomal protein L25/general stress protein Ctc [Gemmatimonadota bacterium]